MRKRRRELLERVTIAELETFVVVAQLGSFTAAAEHLRLTQPATTSRVQKLEAALDVQLLVRTTRKVVTSPAGEELLRQLDGALDRLEHVLVTARAASGEAVGRVAVATTPHIAASLLFPLIREFTAETGVEVTVLDLDYRDVLHSLDSGEADIAILSEGDDGRRTCYELGSDEVVLVVPEHHRLAGRATVAPADLAGEQITLLRPYGAVGRSLSGAAPGAVTIHWVGSLTTLLGLLREDSDTIGAITRGAAARHGFDAARIIRIPELGLRRDYRLFHAHERPTPTARRLSAFLRNAVRHRSMLHP